MYFHKLTHSTNIGIKIRYNFEYCIKTQVKCTFAVSVYHTAQFIFRESCKSEIITALNGDKIYVFIKAQSLLKHGSLVRNKCENLMPLDVLWLGVGISYLLIVTHCEIRLVLRLPEDENTSVDPNDR